MADIDKQINEILKKVDNMIKKQDEINKKVDKIQQIVDNIKDDIYSDGDFDFEIVCPYCEYEFVVDMNENQKQVECPECGNLIELDWSGEDLDEYDDECSGHCHGCSGCYDSDEDDDM